MGLRGFAWVILSTVGIGILSDLRATAGGEFYGVPFALDRRRTKL